MIKRFFLVIVLSSAAVFSFGQPSLRPDNIEEIVKAMTDEEIASLLVGSKEPDFYFFEGTAAGVRGIPRLGIPATISCDGPAGLHFYPFRDNTDKTFYCTAFPVGTLSASSWDPALMEQMAEAMGNEVHEYGVDMFLGPGMNIHRNPLCGRNFEYFSEDPLLSGKMAAAYVRGIQNNGVTATVKHFAANNQETNRHENDARIGQRALREIYLKNFEIAIKEGRPGALMASYNKLNGDYTQQSYYLLTTILRDEWGYEGVVLTDHGAKEGTVKAAKAVCDLMQPGNEEELERMLDAVKTGVITRAELERNARHVLRYIVSTPRYQGYKFSNDPNLKAHAELARKVAGESIVMLKNDDGTLPLKAGSKLAVYGIGSEDFIGVGIGSGHVVAKHMANMRESLTDAGFELDQDLAGYYKACVDLDHAAKRLADAMDWLMYESWGYGKKVAEPDVPLNLLPKQAAGDDVAVIMISRDAGEGYDRSINDDFELGAKEKDIAPKLKEIADAYYNDGFTAYPLGDRGKASE